MKASLRFGADSMVFGDDPIVFDDDPIVSCAGPVPVMILVAQSGLPDKEKAGFHPVHGRGILQELRVASTRSASSSSGICG